MAFFASDVTKRIRRKNLTPMANRKMIFVLYIIFLFVVRAKHFPNFSSKYV